MGFTTDQYNALVSALAQGARRVKYADEEVEYASISDMLKLKAVMEKDLGLSSPGVKTKYAKFTTGLNKC